MFKVQDSYYEQFKHGLFWSLIMALVFASFTFKEMPNYFSAVISWFIALTFLGNPICIFAIFKKNKDLKRGLRIDGDGLYFQKKTIVTPWGAISVRYLSTKSFIGKNYLLEMNATNELYKFEISEYNEKSLIELINRFAPEDHSIRNCIQLYIAEKNK